MISGIVHGLTSASRWCDCPADHGPSLLLALGNVADVTAAPELLARMGQARYVLGDKGYDADPLLRALEMIVFQHC